MIVHEGVPIGAVGQAATTTEAPGFFTQIATGFAKAIPDIAKSAADIYKTKLDTRSAIKTMREQSALNQREMQQQYAMQQPQYPPGYQPGAYAANQGGGGSGLSTGAILAIAGGGILFLGLMIVAFMPKAPASTTA
jgi:hypothetical protein